MAKKTREYNRRTDAQIDRIVAGAQKARDSGKRGALTAFLAKQNPPVTASHLYYWENYRA